MARSHFGGTSTDWLMQPYRFGARTLLALDTDANAITFWSAATGGTQYTDLLNASGAAVSAITFTGYQLPDLQGPDGVLAMWADKGDGSPRERMEARDLAAAATAVAAAATSATAAAASATTAAAVGVDKAAKKAVGYYVADYYPNSSPTAAQQHAALTAACTAASAAGGTVILDPGVTQVVGSFSLSGFSCSIVGQGTATDVGNEPLGSVIQCVSQTGPVLNFTGFRPPHNQTGRLRFSHFTVRGDGTADASTDATGSVTVGGGTKKGIFIPSQSLYAATLNNLLITNCGGIHLDVIDMYLSDLSAIIVTDPISAATNNVPYVRMRACNGIRVTGLGLRSTRTAGPAASVGTVGAMRLEASALSYWDRALFTGCWTENCWVPSGGAIVVTQTSGVSHRDWQFYDGGKVTGATGTSYMRLEPSSTGGTVSGNIVDGFIRGCFGGTNEIDYGVDLTQGRNRIQGIKGYPGNNVRLGSNIPETLVFLGGSEGAGTTDPAVVDNSGRNDNTIIDTTVGLWQITGSSLVRTTAQSLTSGQQAQARSNIGVTTAAGAALVFDVVSEYGADPFGVVDATAAIAAAAADMVAAGRGVLSFQPGIYKVTSLPSFVPKTATGPLTYAVQGAGSGNTIIMHYGTSQAASLRVSNPSFDPSNPSTGAPLWSGFTIDGTNSSGGCCGLVWGDVSYGSFFDVQMKNFASGDGWFFNNPYGWTEGVGMQSCRAEYNGNQLRFDVGSGALLGTVTTTISSGAAFGTVNVSGGLTKALSTGQKIVIAAGTSAIGVTTQTLTVVTGVSAGATSFSATGSGNASTTYTSGTAKVYVGSYGSFDYWTVDSLYVQANANQNGIVSEISRGLSQNMQRVGSRIRVTGNTHTGVTNTGAAFLIKGDDTWNDTVWQVSIEQGGSGVAHAAVNITSTSGAITGNGTFIMLGLGPATFAGGIYQFGVTGEVTVNGVTDSTGLVFRQTRRPGYLDVASGVTPARGGTSASPVAGQYPNTVSNASSWQNTTGTDVLVTVPIAFTGTGTAAWNVEVWSGLPSNLAAPMAAGPSGVTIPLTFIHYARMWARIDVTNATIGAPVIRYHD